MTMALPKQYEWLSKEPGPRLLTVALSLHGTAEQPGIGGPTYPPRIGGGGAAGAPPSCPYSCKPNPDITLPPGLFAQFSSPG